MQHILLADDHKIVRIGIKSLLHKSLRQYQFDEAEDENSIAQLVKEKNYDLILLEINLAGGDFVKLLHWLGSVAPQARILIFSLLDEHIYGLRCLQLGAKGYLHKSASDTEIITAINRVLDDKKYISPDLAELLSDNNIARHGNPLSNLSAREMEIMTMLNTGKSINEICASLNIQYSTVSTFKRRIFDKLHIKNMHSLYKMVEHYQQTC